jgi:ABC-type Fe3+-siderophore transport system permease subunit
VYGAYTYGSYLGAAIGSVIVSLILRILKIWATIGSALFGSAIMFLMCYVIIKNTPNNIRDVFDLVMPYLNEIILSIIYLMSKMILIKKACRVSDEKDL